MKNLRRLLGAYRYLLGILMRHAPVVVSMVFLLSVLAGLLAPLGVYVGSSILNLSLRIADKTADFSALVPYLWVFALCALGPSLISLYVQSIAEPRCMLTLRSAFRGDMLQKLKRLRYEHLESRDAMEVIDKAYSRAENAARHLFPMYIHFMLPSMVSAIGSLYLIASLKWWLVFPILLPFVVETILQSRNTFNIYDELESYWQQEKEYETLRRTLQNRDYVRENRLNQASDYLIDVYQSRFHARNKQYEGYFFKHLRKMLLSSNVTRFGILGNALILLWLYLGGQINVGMFITVSLLVFTALYDQLGYSVFIFKWGHYHINFFDFYRHYFDLSEDPQGQASDMPEHFDIEFRDVWFRYPGTERDILKGLSFTIRDGEKVSVVGENGEGKSTMVKLLLGLFLPDRGEILVGGKNLADYTLTQRVRLFGTVFQDFSRFSITLEENIVIGDLAARDDGDKLATIAQKAGLSHLLETLPDHEKTLLGKEFEGGNDLSGGQWQRIAMARALYGDKPILILDEPTSQLDPMAESALYGEFASIANGKTSLFITHRLGSTAITDTILVISGGRVTQTGTHEELLAAGGLYADMFESQKSWYDRTGKEVPQHV